MYAIIKTGGKQHKVSVGDKLRVERLNVQPGEEVNFTPILVSADNKVDFNENGKWTVKATAVKELKARKVLVFHKKKIKEGEETGKAETPIPATQVNSETARATEMPTAATPSENSSPEPPASASE